MINPTELPDLDRLEALARAATTGPWLHRRDPSNHGAQHCVKLAGEHGAWVCDCIDNTDRSNIGGIAGERNAAFIAAANPAAVLALIALARRPPVPALRPTDDELWDSTIRDRDTYHEWADKLADAIASYFGVDIGEHSNQNCPWHEALEAIESADPARRAQPEGEAPQAEPEPNPSLEDCPEDDQHWAKVDPAVAFHLIERHAEDWADAGRMMLQWHKAMSRPAQLDGGQGENHA